MSRLIIRHFEPRDIEARTTLWAAGVGASPLARTLGVPLDRAGRVTNGRRRISRSTAQLLSLALVLLVMCAGFACLTGRFADVDNLRNVLLQAAPTMIGSVGMTFVIAARGIDLSIGAIANLSLACAIAAAGTRSEAELTTDTVWLVYPLALAAGVGA